jgi:tripartite-type tricarboxylate transporter receptor subunit TctC
MGAFARSGRLAVEAIMRAMRAIRWLVGCALLLALRSVPVGAQAQDYPTRAIRIIVGPSPDIFSRIIAEHLKEVWGQPVIVEPRPGAGGKLAATAVSTAAPDGYTLLFATPTYTLNTAMKLASYDLMKEFEPVAMVGMISYALVVHPSVPAKSVAELVAYAKAHPGAVNCASAGIGTVPHLACELVNKQAGVDVVHVPFRDVNSGMVATMGGVTQMFFGVSTNAKPQIESGALRGLAVSTVQRSLLLPSLPTMVESGFPQFVIPGWGGLMAPAGTPKTIVDKLNLEVQRALDRPELQQRLISVGMEPPPRYTPAQFREFIAGDIARWTTFVDIVGLDKLQGANSP